MLADTSLFLCAPLERVTVSTDAAVNRLDLVMERERVKLAPANGERPALSYMKTTSSTPPPDWFVGLVERADGTLERWRQGVREAVAGPLECNDDDEDPVAA